MTGAWTPGSRSRNRSRLLSNGAAIHTQTAHLWIFAKLCLDTLIWPMKDRHGQ